MNNADQGKIIPLEFVKYITEKLSGTCRKNEDVGFCRLKRGYSDDILSDWVC